MSQLELSIKPPMQELDTATVARQPTFTQSLVLCQTLSGLEDKELCGKNGIINADATWSRIKSGSNFFPQDNLSKFMHLCGNEAPLIWLADRHGYVLTQKETEWERKCRIEREKNEELMRENTLLRGLVMGKAA